MKGDLFFRWSDADESTWDASFAVNNQSVLSFTRKLGENAFPTLAIVIKNPRGNSGNALGLLSSLLKQWAWLSWDDGTAISPLIWSQVVGIPSNLVGEKITVLLIAKPADYLDRKQTAANRLKELPWYDPIFADPSHRDNPDAVIAGRSAFWHCDAVTHAVTISDYNVGEDGTVDFAPSDSLYDGFDIRLGQIPLASVSVNAQVPWTQTDSGFIDIGWNGRTFTGERVLSDWPKANTGLGGGWTCTTSIAKDVWNIANATVESGSFSWQNREETHEEGDTMSVQISSSGAALPGDGHYYAVTSVQRESVIGFPDFFEITQGGDPGQEIIATTPGQAASAKLELTSITVPLWLINLSATLRYDAKRSRTERVKFTLAADLQTILDNSDSPPGSDTTPTNNQLITISGADVGLPLQTSAVLTSSGTNVSDGDQVVVGDQFYTFQSTLTNADGHVHIGASAAASLDNLRRAIDLDGVAGTNYALAMTRNGDTSADIDGDALTVYSETGSAMRVSTSAATLSWSSEALEAQIGATLTGTANVVDGRQVIIGSRTYTFRSSANFLNTSGYVLIGIDLNASLTNLVHAINALGGTAGTDYGATIASSEVLAHGPFGGNTVTVTGIILQVINVSVSALDGTKAADLTTDELSWNAGFLQGLAPDTLPIGNPSRRSYFPTDRGLRSIEHLICRARAVLLLRARAVQITFIAPFEKVVPLTTRMNVRVLSDRLPGGEATGKVIATTLDFEGGAPGEPGKYSGTVTIGCTVGNGGAATAADGTNDYIDDYIDDYFHATGQVVVLDTGDVGYEVPLDAVDDDGIVFPIGRGYGTVNQNGTASDQFDAIGAVVQPTELPSFDPNVATDGPLTVDPGNMIRVDGAIGFKPTLLTLVLPNLTNGPFNGEYDLDLTPLYVVKTVDLSASA